MLYPRSMFVCSSYHHKNRPLQCRWKLVDTCSLDKRHHNILRLSYRNPIRFCIYKTYILVYICRNCRRGLYNLSNGLGLRNPFGVGKYHLNRDICSCPRNYHKRHLAKQGQYYMLSDMHIFRCNWKSSRSNRQFHIYNDHTMDSLTKHNQRPARVSNIPRCKNPFSSLACRVHFPIRGIVCHLRRRIIC